MKPRTYYRMLFVAFPANGLKQTGAGAKLPTKKVTSNKTSKKMESKRYLKKLAVASVPFVFLAGCGGGGGGGGGGNNGGWSVRIPAPIEAPANLSEENAHEAASLNFMLHDLVDQVGGDFFGGDMLRSSRSTSVSSLTRSGAEGRSSASRSRLNIKPKLAARILAKRNAAVLASRNSGESETEDCPDGGSVTVTETEIRFKNCAYDYEWGGGNYDKLVQDGFISFKEEVRDGYDRATKLTIDLKSRYEEFMDGERERSETYMKGSVLHAFSPDDVDNPDKTLLEITKFDFAGRGEDACGKWDAHVWFRDYVEMSEVKGAEEIVKFSGKMGGAGDGIGLRGTLEVSTDEVLRFDHPGTWESPEFPRGDRVVMKGANGELRVRFSGDGAHAIVELNDEDIAGPFYSWDDFEEWLEVDDDC